MATQVTMRAAEQEETMAAKHEDLILGLASYYLKIQGFLFRFPCPYYCQ